MDIAQKIAEGKFLTERQKKILAMRWQGKTLEEIGRNFGLTRERIRQIGCKVRKIIVQNLTQEELKLYLNFVLENKNKKYARNTK